MYYVYVIELDYSLTKNRRFMKVNPFYKHDMDCLYGSYYPGVYGMRLRPDLFTKFNPLKTQKQAKIMEEKLADDLRRLGYAVWQH